jgi:hypothetical protein
VVEYRYRKCEVLSSTSVQTTKKKCREFHVINLFSNHKKQQLRKKSSLYFPCMIDTYYLHNLRKEYKEKAIVTWSSEMASGVCG